MIQNTFEEKTSKLWEILWFKKICEIPVKLLSFINSRNSHIHHNIHQLKQLRYSNSFLWFSFVIGLRIIKWDIIAGAFLYNLQNFEKSYYLACFWAVYRHHKNWWPKWFRTKYLVKNNLSGNTRFTVKILSHFMPLVPLFTHPPKHKTKEKTWEYWQYHWIQNS